MTIPPFVLRAPSAVTGFVRHRPKVSLAIAAASILLGAYVFSPATSSEVATALVQRGDFAVSLKNSGEIRAANSFTLTTPSSRANQIQIVFLVPEGTTVKEGDVVVRFATTEVDKQILDKESEMSMLLSDLQKFKADKALRDDDLDGSLRNAELTYEQAKLQVEKMKFEAEVQRKESEINLEKNKLAFEQAQRKMKSQSSVDDSEEKKLSIKIAQTKRDLDQARKEKDGFTLRASRGGLVVYETNWSTGRKINVGDNPWQGMPVVSLPDLSKMQSVCNVNEVDVSKVKVGQSVKVSLDAFPDKSFWGSIASVATIGQQKDRNSNLKTFEILINIDGTDPILKPGMTTSNEIVMATLQDTLFIPLESVFVKDGKSLVYRMLGSRAKETEVALGPKNSDFVVVSTAELHPGDRVALRDPTIKDEGSAQKKETAQ